MPDTTCEYILRDGQLIARAVTEHNLELQPTLLADMLGEQHLALPNFGMSKPTPGTKKGGLEASLIYSVNVSIKGQGVRHIIIHLPTVLHLKSLMGMQLEDKSFSLVPHTVQSLTAAPRLMTALPAKVNFRCARKLFLCAEVTGREGEYTFGKHTVKFFAADHANELYPVPMPHVDASGTFCTGELADKNTYFLQDLAGYLVCNSIYRGQWRGHWNPSLGKDYEAELRLHDNHWELTLNKFGRKKTRPSWWPAGLLEAL